jgi:hypothetical protein
VGADERQFLKLKSNEAEPLPGDWLGIVELPQFEGTCSSDSDEDRGLRLRSSWAVAMSSFYAGVLLVNEVSAL